MISEDVCLKYMEEEYEKGARAMFNHLKKEVTGCYNEPDNCSICQAIL